ncbi:MAG: hypothetical protein KC877_00810 [Candidatus Kaiserbacteria bacterium]|nr:hypothetical protein [Candidatus Kaiserbacteria bacterium]MCB9816837.1 hypothetical protein [Candidatus Nomurabacteria bacterium]
MLKLLTAIVDILFPPSTEEILLRSTKPTDYMKLYRPGRIGSCEYLCHYQDPIIRAAITSNKFHYHRRGSILLGTLLSNWVDEQATDCVFIPIPLGKKRMRTRGHNQVLTILQAANVATAPHLLTREIETKQQSKLDKVARQQNVRGAFTYTDKPLPQGTTVVVLVDDVFTTGATMRAARAALAPHLPPHVKLICLAIAH